MGAFRDPEILELLGEPSGRDLSIAGEAYEGASRASRELALWSPAIRSADMDILPSKGRADARNRDTMRNDAYVQGGANIHRDSIVGSLFLLNSKPSTKILFGKDDDIWEDEYQEEVEERFGLWAESPDNWVDAARINTLTSMVRLAVGIHTAAGELLASAEWLRDNVAARPFNTAIQMVDVDRLSTPPKYMSDDQVRGGVRRNQFGAPQSYYVRMAHPSDYKSKDVFQWKEVPTRKPWGRLQMIHIYEQTRPDQTRGMAQMVSALKEMRMTKNFRDIVLQNAVVNATYAASIESELPTEAIFARLGGGDMDQKSISDALNGYVGAWMEEIGQYVGGSKNLQIDGVKIPHLPPGSKLQLRPAGTGGPLGTEFEQSLLRHIAASLDVSYEQLSRDYTKTNYSSARAALTETWKAMKSRKKMIADRFATAIYRLWLEEAINKGVITSLPRRAPSWYEGQNADAYSSCDWIGASRGQIDELKETQAAILRINNGLSDLEEENARLGGDWRKRLRQMAREQKWKKDYGVLQAPTDTTNQMNAASGTESEANANA